jgi:hypothetical protein
MWWGGKGWLKVEVENSAFIVNGNRNLEVGLGMTKMKTLGKVGYPCGSYARSMAGRFPKTAAVVTRASEVLRSSTDRKV